MKHEISQNLLSPNKNVVTLTTVAVKNHHLLLQVLFPSQQTLRKTAYCWGTAAGRCFDAACIKL